MITLQHAALTALAIYKKNGANNFEESFNRIIPWTLLPDGIRAYIGQRQPSHFEMLPNGTDCSWMDFPSPSVLKGLTKENVKDRIKFYLADGYPQCAIGEETNLASFDVHNWSHQYYQALRMHILQDMVLDNTLREKLIDVERRFDNKFVVRHNRTIVLNGDELRTMVTLFEQVGFLYLVGRIYESTNGAILLNQAWYDEHVYRALREAYSVDLAERTYHFMKIPYVLETRINAHDFVLTDSDKGQVILAENPQETFDEMYSMALYFTLREC